MTARKSPPGLDCKLEGGAPKAPATFPRVFAPRLVPS